MKKDIIKTKDALEVISYEFDSLYEYVEYLKKGTITPNFERKESSRATDNVEWAGTSSYEEAEQLCLEGEYDEKFDDFDKERMKLEKIIAEKRSRTKIKKDIIGFAPNVPAYLKGLPKNMYNIDKHKKNAQKVIDIYYQISALSGVTPTQMRNRGICTLTLIKELEREGYSVNLHLFKMSDCRGQRLFCQWHLKKPGQPIDYRSLYFPMVNPSFLRRLNFRLTEITPELSSAWVGGYGSTCDYDKVRNFLQVKPTTIVINQPKDHYIRGENIEKDYEGFMKSIQFQLDKAKNYLEEKERMQEDDGGRK